MSAIEQDFSRDNEIFHSPVTDALSEDISYYQSWSKVILGTGIASLTAPASIAFVGHDYDISTAIAISIIPAVFIYVMQNQLEAKRLAKLGDQFSRQRFLMKFSLPSIMYRASELEPAAYLEARDLIRRAETVQTNHASFMSLVSDIYTRPGYERRFRWKELEAPAADFERLIKRLEDDQDLASDRFMFTRNPSDRPRKLAAYAHELLLSIGKVNDAPKEVVDDLALLRSTKAGIANFTKFTLFDLHDRFIHAKEILSLPSY